MPTTATDETRTIPVRRRGETPWLRRTMILLICIVIADSLVGERGIAERLRARRAYEQAEVDLQALRHQNAALREHVRRLERDPATIEAVARQELGLIRPGEILVFVRDVR